MLPEYDIVFWKFCVFSLGMDEKIIASDRGVHIIYFMENSVSSFRMHVIEFFVNENPYIKFD